MPRRLHRGYPVGLRFLSGIGEQDYTSFWDLLILPRKRC